MTPIVRLLSLARQWRGIAEGTMREIKLHARKSRFTAIVEIAITQDSEMPEVVLWWTHAFRISRKLTAKSPIPCYVECTSIESRTPWPRRR